MTAAPGKTKTRIPMPAGDDTGIGNHKDKNSYAQRGRHRHRELQRQESLCPPGMILASGITSARIPMPAGVNTGTGKYKDKNPYARRGRHWHRKSQGQEFLCLPGTIQAPGITRARIPMLSGDDTGTGKYKDKNFYARRRQHRHREIQRQEFLCLPETLQAPGNTKTRIPMPAEDDTGTGNYKGKNSYAQRGRHRHREIQRQEFLCPPGTIQAPGITRARIPMPTGYNSDIGKQSKNPCAGECPSTGVLK